MKQFTIEGCLATCLLHSIGKHSRKNELALFMEAVQHNLKSFPLAHADVFSRRYAIPLDLYFENKRYAQEIKKIKHSKLVNIKSEKIDLKFISRAAPAIVLMDEWIFGAGCHQLHYMIIERIEGDKVSAVDPHKGKITFSKQKLKKAVSYLRNKMWWTPVLIRTTRTAPGASRLVKLSKR